MQNIESSADLPSVCLYFQEGSSDKVYQCQVVAKGEGYVLNFQNGPRGGTMKSGTKTPKPVTLETALFEYHKLVKSKTKKGYSPVEGGDLYQDTVASDRVTGLRPQLLNAIDLEEASFYIRNDAFCGQQKFDGERRMVERRGDVVRGANRDGLEVALPKAIEHNLLKIGAQGFVLDAEIIGTTLYVFDVLDIDGEDLRDRALEDRLSRMSVLLSALKEGDAIVAATTAFTTDEKRRMFAHLKATNQEGMVFKCLASPYRPGRPNSGGDQLKFKFVESATLEVASVHSTKRSIEVQGFDDAGRPVDLGNVTIPANQAIPQVGDIVEVKYLYAYPNGGSLFQPVYKCPRNDRGRDACTLSQLKYKASHQTAVACEAA